MSCLGRGSRSNDNSSDFQLWCPLATLNLRHSDFSLRCSSQIRMHTWDDYMQAKIPGNGTNNTWTEVSRDRWPLPRSWLHHCNAVVTTTIQLSFDLLHDLRWRLSQQRLATPRFVRCFSTRSSVDADKPAWRV